MKETTDIAASERIGPAVIGALLIVHALARPSLARLIVGTAGGALLWRGLTRQWPLSDMLAGKIGGDTAFRRIAAAERDPVTVASEDSFPASDPPAWTPVAGTGRHH